MKDIYVDFGSATGILGESRDTGEGSTPTPHKGWVEVSTFSHIIRQPRSATASSSGGHTSERVEFGDLVFTKDIDSATPMLMHAACAAVVIPTVKIQFYRAHGGNSIGSDQKRVDYYTLELKNVIVSSVATSMSPEGLPVETFTLKPSAMQWTYKPQEITGLPGPALKKSWNLATNSPKFA
jgi:type VI secretion system secreted protein Hcp